MRSQPDDDNDEGVDVQHCFQTAAEAVETELDGHEKGEEGAAAFDDDHDGPWGGSPKAMEHARGSHVLV